MPDDQNNNTNQIGYGKCFDSDSNRNNLKFDLPQPPSPSALKKFEDLNLFVTNDNYSKNQRDDLHADFSLVKNCWFIFYLYSCE